MPTGPNGEKCPTDPIANAVHVMRVATGEAEEMHDNDGQNMGGQERANNLTAEERRETARKAAAARWTE